AGPGARQRAGGGPLRARLPAAEARRSRRRRPAPAGVPGASAQGARRAKVDRARHPGPARPRVVRRVSRGSIGGGAVTRWGPRGAGALALALAAATACGKLGPDFNQVVAIEVAALDSVEERSEEHTSELQSRSDLVCRLLL